MLESAQAKASELEVVTAQARQMGLEASDRAHAAELAADAARKRADAAELALSEAVAQS